ncbi:MAG: PAS domain S-box protein [Microscillaceae bacterium]|jgi:PAS domain S-box-containing protein|nr:PAS domain S-box protein [Microscillaceae bacterium]
MTKFISKISSRFLPHIISLGLWLFSCVWITAMYFYAINPFLINRNHYTDHHFFWASLLFATLTCFVLYQLFYRTYQALYHTQEDYRHLFTQNPNPMWVFERENYCFIEVNEAAIQHYGFSRDEFLKMTIYDIRPAEDIEKVKNLTRKDSKLGYQQLGVWRHRKKNGEVIWVDISANHISFNGKQSGMVIARDITENYLAQQTIENYKNRLENVLESITDAFCTLNKNLEFTYINPAFMQFMPQTLDFYLGKKIDEVLPFIKTDGFLAYYEKVLSSQESCHFEIFSSFTQRYLNVSVYPTAEGLISYSQDITAYKKALEKITQQNERLRKIAFIQSHILRRPLANSMGLVEMMKDNWHNRQIYEECLIYLETALIETDLILHQIVADTELIR